MSLHIRFDDQDRTLYAELSPSEDSDIISSLSLHEKLEEAGYPHFTLNPKAITEVLAKAQQGTACTIALKTLVDATVTVEISRNKGHAYVTLTDADGGQPLTLDMITHAIAEAGVSDARVDQEMVNQGYQQKSVKDLCIAQAIFPIQGSDAVYIPLVESEAIAPPDVDDHGVADMMNTHQFVLVDVGTPLMHRVPPTEGEAGVDVTGQEMKAEPGKDPGFTKDLTGVEISSEDPNVLLATVKGHPVVVRNGVNIDATLHVENVDVKTGNITFDGSLEVKGDVANGMTIDVTGDVFIQGGVEGAVIKAGRNIKVGGGIFGQEDAECPDEETIAYNIQAGSDIEAKFVQLATLRAGNNIVVKEYMSHSYVKSGNQLLIGQKSGKGIVFGGQCEALHHVKINQLGNETFISTHVTVGRLSELTRAYHTLEKELATRSQEAAQLEAILEKTQKNASAVLGKVSLDKSEKIRNTIVAIHGRMESTQERLRAMEPEFALQKEATITVARRIYPNAVMTINGMTTRFPQQMNGATWVQGANDLVEQEKKE